MKEGHNEGKTESEGRRLSGLEGRGTESVKGRRRRKTQGRGAGGRQRRWQEGKEAGKVEEMKRKREGNRRATKM